MWRQASGLLRPVNVLTASHQSTPMLFCRECEYTYATDWEGSCGLICRILYPDQVTELKGPLFSQYSTYSKHAWLHQNYVHAATLLICQHSPVSTPARVELGPPEIAASYMQISFTGSRLASALTARGASRAAFPSCLPSPAHQQASFRSGFHLTVSEHLPSSPRFVFVR